VQEDARLTRDELYGLVWTEPMWTLAKRYGFSDVGLAKICKKLRVPVPWRGYWARKQAGQNVRRTPLGKLPAGAGPAMREVVIRQRVVAHADGSDADGPVESQERFERNPANEIHVASILEAPHSLVAQSVLALRRSKANASGVLQPKPGTCLDVRVSPAAADRAMCILDALLKALETRGIVVSIRAGESPVTVARVGEEEVPFHVEERFARVERKPSRYSWPEYESVASGELAIRIDHYWAQGRRQSWADGKKQRVEGCLNAFVASLYAIADLMRVRRLEQEERERASRAEEARRQAVKRRRDFEEGRVRTLDRVIANWRDARLFREYVADVQRAADNVELSAELSRWLAWVEAYADRIDPLKPSPQVPEPEPPERSEYASWMHEHATLPLFDPEEP